MKGNSYFTDFTTYSKPMVFSFLFREFHLTGMTFLPTTEANINYLCTDSEKPFTFAHEIIHIIREHFDLIKNHKQENEANFGAGYMLAPTISYKFIDYLKEKNINRNDVINTLNKYIWFMNDKEKYFENFIIKLWGLNK